MREQGCAEGGQAGSRAETYATSAAETAGADQARAHFSARTEIHIITSTSSTREGMQAIRIS